MHEHHRLPTGKKEVRGTGQITVVPPAVNAQLPQLRGERFFRASVGDPDDPHDVTSLLLLESICHGSHVES